MGKRLINVDEVEEIIPVLVGKLLENNLITEKQADQIICAIFNDNCLGEYGEGDVHQDVETMANEAEGCIINSMEDVLNVLKNLRKYKGVNWSQLLEVGIDNADDLYWWYVTFSIDTTAV